MINKGLQDGGILLGGERVFEQLVSDLGKGLLHVLALEGRSLLVGDTIVSLKPVFYLLNRDLSLRLLVRLVTEDEEREVLRVLRVGLNQEVLAPERQVFKALGIRDVID